MADGISGIKDIVPTYPVKPAQRSKRDRESGSRETNPPKPEAGTENEDDDNPVIDEYI